MNKCRICQQIYNNLTTVSNNLIKYLAQSILKLKGYTDTLDINDCLKVCEDCKQGLESLSTFWETIPEAKQEESLETSEFVEQIDKTNECFNWKEEYKVTPQGNADDLSSPTSVSPEHSSIKDEMFYEPIKIRIKLPPKRTRKKNVDENVDTVCDTKRLRRPPKRYEDFKLNSSYKIRKKEEVSDEFRKNSVENLAPVVALIRLHNGCVIGKLLEVESNGLCSRIRIICEKCSKVFRFEKEFCKHFKNHDNDILNESLNDESYSFHCTLCDKSFPEHISVRRHYRLSHSEERPLKCQHCDASFKYKFNLDYHMAKHVPKKRFDCVFCKKSFLYRYELQIHVRTHTKEKPYKCEFCPWAFAHRSNLKAHQKTKHFVDSAKPTSLKNAAITEETNQLNESLKESLPELENKTVNSIGEEKILLDNTNCSSEISFPTNYQDFSSHIKDLETTELTEEFITTDNNFETLSSGIFENTDKIIENLENNESTKEITSNAMERFKAPANFGTFRIDESILKVLNSSDLLGLKKWPKYYQNTSVAKETNNSNVSNQQKTVNNLEKDNKFEKVEKNTEKESNIVDKTKDLEAENNSVVKFKCLDTNSSKSSDKNSTQLSNTSVPNTSTSTSFNRDSVTEIPNSNSNLESAQTDNKKRRNFEVSSGSSLLKGNKFVNINELSNANNSPPNLQHLGIVKEIKIIDKNVKNSKDKTDSSSSSINNIQVCNTTNSKSKNNSRTWNVIKVSPRPIKIINISNLNKFKKDVNITANSNHQQQKSESFIASTPSKTNHTSKTVSSNFLLTSPMPKVPLKSTKSQTSLLKPLSKNQENSILTSKNSSQNPDIAPNKPLITNIEILPPLPTLPVSTISFHSQDNRISNPVSTSDKDYEVRNIDINHDSSAVTATNSSIPPPFATSQNPIKPPASYKYQCPYCWKYFKQKSPLTKHLRTHTGEKPYKCNLCPKSYADASNYKKHKILHKNAAEALNIKCSSNSYAVATSPAYSTVSDPDPDGIEVMQTIKKFVNPSTDDDDDVDDNASLSSSTMESDMWQDALENVLMNEDIRENIKRNLMGINNAIMPKIMQESPTINKGNISESFSTEDPD